MKKNAPTMRQIRAAREQMSRMIDIRQRQIRRELCARPAVKKLKAAQLAAEAAHAAASKRYYAAQDEAEAEAKRRTDGLVDRVGDVCYGATMGLIDADQLVAQVSEFEKIAGQR